ncbi:unnamed protein product [Brassica oleracea var. botrytis]|uniref:(rape) hypothetical protein n=1 Tax=Brassica napus TaxID=3708 RepID=A0A816IIU9_BRANA|nr:unnamed protein product [Brassica napus]
MVGFSDKDRELGEAHAEIKALRLSERQREKAVEEVFYIMSLMFILYLWLTDELTKLEEKLKLTESLLQGKVIIKSPP